MILSRSLRLIFILLGVSCMNSELSDPKKVINGYITALIASDFSLMRYYSTAEKAEAFKDDWMLQAMSKLKNVPRREEDYNWEILSIETESDFANVKMSLISPNEDSIAEKVAELTGVYDRSKRVVNSYEEAEKLARKDPSIKPLNHQLKVRLKRIAAGWVVDTNNAELIKIFFPNYKP